jgi:ABC-type glycerol-3-phosphate transport system permease component
MFRLRAILRSSLLYGLLLAGTALFALPFFWMIGSSFKVDREMFGRKLTLWPQRPVPATASPWLDPAAHPDPETDLSRRALPEIAAALRAIDLDLPPSVADRDQAVSILAPAVFARLRDTLARAAWELPDPEFGQRLRAETTPALAAETARRLLRRLVFGPVRVRSIDLQEADLTQDLGIPDFWTLSYGPARWLLHADTAATHADLAYEFTGKPTNTIVLSATLDLPFPEDRLSRIQVSLTPDDSWHALDFQLEYGGKRYRALQPEILGQFNPKVVTLQEFGPMDAPDSNRIKLWIPYRETDAGPQYESRPGKVRLVATLRQSSQARAWSFKCTRNYRTALRYIPFWRYAATSAFLVVMNVVGNLFACSLVAYAFARLHWPGRNFAFGLMLATMMIPPQVTMIPYFLIIRWLGWYNTLSPLWVISFFGNAFNIFLLRQFMKGIPRDMEDAARIDGCNFLQIYWYVILPLIKPTLACIAIFTFMAVWNDFMGPLIFLADQQLYPLSLGLYALNVQQGGDFGMMMAGSLLMTLPVILLFFFAQKYFIQGITLTGSKG